jgi:plastocyanin
MKKLLPRLAVFVLFILNPSFSKATTYTVTAADFQFSPDILINILVGDTIHWTWQNGLHTTTSNGIPDGAAPWNELLDSLHTSFTYVIAVPGTYHYISVPDLPGMQGEFTVLFPIGISSPKAFEAGVAIFPNIIRDNVHISFELPENGALSISIYDLQGRKAETLFEGKLAAGKYNEVYYLREKYSSGIYFVNVRYNSISVAKRIVIE